MKIIFMGSPSFALPALQALIDSSHEIICTYTREPKPSGRGKKITKTPIHILSEQNNIPVFTPKTLKGKSINYNADIIVVAAYGILLPEKILKQPKYGCINIHPSLLPRWRGAAPIQHAILAGDKKTGVCIMQMTEELDAGDILSTQQIDIDELDDYQSLHDKLSTIGAKLLLEVIEKITEIKPIKQNNLGITYASKIKKELVNWNNSATAIMCKIKALQKIDCIIKDKKIKLLKAEVDNSQHNFAPGTITNDKLHIACGKGILKPKILQISGKSPIDIDSFLHGNKLF
ncbi:MAG: methionyl-tRNA formyltransferase [Rickettsiaceae bacterium H1]|nr:methionyl-tRNA formyltransferase [Rickettsiaceae bacterium H1]